MIPGIDRDNYVTVLGWMVTDLHLKGNELLTYAIIYGFCQDGESEFTGSVAYIQAWTGLSYQGVANILKSLVEKELLKKISVVMNGVTLCRYQTLYPPKKVDTLPKKLIPSQESWDNIDSNIDIYKEKDTNVSQKKEPSRFTPPTIEQVRDYCNMRGNGINPEAFVDFYQSKGWKVGNTPMKDWKAAVRTWERGHSKSAQKRQDESKIEAAFRVMREMGITEDNTIF